MWIRSQNGKIFVKANALTLEYRSDFTALFAHFGAGTEDCYFNVGEFRTEVAALNEMLRFEKHIDSGSHETFNVVVDL